MAGFPTLSGSLMQLEGQLLSLEAATTKIVGKVRQGIGEVETLQNGVVERTREIHLRLAAETETAAQVAAEKAFGFFAQVKEEQRGLQIAVTEVVKGVERAAEESKKTAEKTRESVAERFEGMWDSPREKLEEFLARFEEVGYAESEKLLKLVDLIKIGAAEAKDLIEIYRGAKAGAEDLADAFRRLDIGQLGDEIQELIGRMKRNAVDFKEIMEFLGERAGDLGEKIRAWVEALKAGKIDFEELRKKFEALGDEFGGTALDTFLQELVDAIREGKL